VVVAAFPSSSRWAGLETSVGEAAAAGVAALVAEAVASAVVVGLEALVVVVASVVAVGDRAGEQPTAVSLPLRTRGL
jgi:hypothetical protein